MPKDYIRFYLLRIAKNLDIDLLRKRKRRGKYASHRKMLYDHWNTLDVEIQEEVRRILLMVSNAE